MRDVLAHCASFRSWSPGTRYAAELATAIGASLTGIYVGSPTPPAGAVGLTGPGPAQAWFDEWMAFATEEVHCAMLAGHSFTDWAHAMGVTSAYWQVALGDAGEALSVASALTDLLVVERRGDNPDSVDMVSRTLLSSMPCIVVPQMPYMIGRIERMAVAWNGSPSSTRALQAAIPLLCRAGHVVLMQPGDRSEAPAPGAGRPVLDAAWHLRRHGIEPVVEIIAASGDEAGHAITAAASRHRTDLLVMGAQGKKSGNEYYLGKTTCALLRNAGQPLFMRH